MKLDGKAVKTLWIAFFVLVAITVAQNLLILYSAEPAAQGKATADNGQVNLCINHKPKWLNEVTCPDGYTLEPYGCNVSAIDPDADNISEYTATVLAGNPNGSQLFDNITADGTMNLTPQINQSGNYTVQITARDNKTCPLSNTTTVNITIVQNQHAPRLVKPVPNSTWDEDTILVPYDLDDHFEDPEGEPLSYRATGNTQIKVTISDQGEVTLDPAQDYCGEEIIHYTATDVTNLTADSNDVTLTVECKEEEEQEQESGDSGGGGGGGGGGAALPTNTCTEDYYCYEWSACQYTEAVTATGDSHELNITGVLGERTYLVEDMPEDTSVFYEGFQWRECVDTNKCTADTDTYVRSCEYQPSCNDHIQNQDETDVDCGGVCPPCGTCNDGVQNGLEKGVDCGGPDCKPCHTCTDGVLNGQELDVDCGGPDCPACATCFDGIQNQGETGVDCGGPCGPCAQEQEPAATASNLTAYLLGGVILAALALLAVWLSRKRLQALLASLALRYKKKNRLILIDHDVRSRLLAELSELRGSIGSEDALHVQARFARIVRRYYQQAFGLDFEFRAQDLSDALEEAGLLDLLKPVLSRLYAQVARFEFSGDQAHPDLLRAVFAEFASVVRETSVFTRADLQERAQAEPPYPQREADDPLEHAYLGLLTAQIALEHNNLLVAERTYKQLHEYYSEADDSFQEALHPHLDRLYHEMRLASHVQDTFWTRRE